jgi:hypothetical protein
MSPIWIVFLVAALQAPAAGSVEPEHLFRSGKTWEQFLDSVSAQREF